MKPAECSFEEEVIAAVIQSRWPERASAELRTHVSGCAICSDVALVAGALDLSKEAVRDSAVIPDSGRVWWLAQMRLRREATRDAGRPITAAQVLAFASAIGLLGACFGASSAWFQELLQQAEPMIFEAITQHSGMVALVIALMLALPGAVYWAVLRD